MQLPSVLVLSIEAPLIEAEFEGGPFSAMRLGAAWVGEKIESLPRPGRLPTLPYHPPTRGNPPQGAADCSGFWVIECTIFCSSEAPCTHKVYQCHVALAAVPPLGTGAPEPGLCPVPGSGRLV